jgi:beta-glucosidase
MFRMTDDSHWNNTWWMDPVYLGRYPADGLAIYGRSVPEFDPDDMKVIAQPLDFCGVNLYTTEFWKAGTTGPERVPHPDGCPMNTLRWPINAPAMYWGPRFFHRRYGLPVVITEHGMCNTDWVMRDGCVHDPQRIDFLEGQLAQLGSAIADGVPVSGYFHWSLMDNFEWANGYSQRFGLIHVDYATQRRTPKDSYHWYRGVIAAHSERAP